MSTLHRSHVESARQRISKPLLTSPAVLRIQLDRASTSLGLGTLEKAATRKYLKSRVALPRESAGSLATVVPANVRPIAPVVTVHLDRLRASRCGTDIAVAGSVFLTSGSDQRLLRSRRRSPRQGVAKSDRFGSWLQGRSLRRAQRALTRRICGLGHSDRRVQRLHDVGRDPRPVWSRRGRPVARVRIDDTPSQLCGFREFRGAGVDQFDRPQRASMEVSASELAGLGQEQKPLRNEKEVGRRRGGLGRRRRSSNCCLDEGGRLRRSSRRLVVRQRGIHGANTGHYPNPRGIRLLPHRIRMRLFASPRPLLSAVVRKFFRNLFEEKTRRYTRLRVRCSTCRSSSRCRIALNPYSELLIGSLCE